MEKVLERPVAEVSRQPKPPIKLRVALKSRRVLGGEMRDVGTIIADLGLRGSFTAAHLEKAIIAGDVNFEIGS